MKPSLFALPSSTAAFSVVELLVAMGLFAVLGEMMIHSFSIQTHIRRDVELRSETNQGIAAALDALVRDIRLAGACLPTQPLFVPIAGIDNGALDTLTIRTGAVSATTACTQTTLSAALAAGGNSIAVRDLTGFKVDALAYISSGVAGEFLRVTALSGASGAGTVTTDSTLTQSYVVNSGVWALEERVYRIDSSTYSQPALTRSINRQAAVPIATGIEQFDVSYRLNENCPSCTEIALPPDNPTWVEVTEVIVSLRARSRAPLSTGSVFLVSTTSAVQPRNILAFRSS
jgi:hypothetical protein